MLVLVSQRWRRVSIRLYGVTSSSTTVHSHRRHACPILHNYSTQLAIAAMHACERNTIYMFSYNLCIPGPLYIFVYLWFCVEVGGVDSREDEPAEGENSWAIRSLHDDSRATQPSGHAPASKHRPHHFSTQILSVLTSAHAAEELNSGGACLHDIALRFRLLRQQGFWVSPGTS